MLNFFKNFGRGILYILVLPLLLVALAVYAVFGSCARKEETPESDVDFLVELQKGASLFDLMDLQDEYEALLNCKVDVVSRRGLNPYLRDNVLSEAVVL